MATFLAGFALGFSLILAIGAQNAFVLKQGLRRQHVFLVCLLCAGSDALLIALGVSGFGAVVEEFPAVAVVARYGGAAFLLVYGALSFRAALGKAGAPRTLSPAGEDATSRAQTLAICLAFTWLNPHVYLDTLVLLGSVSTQYADAVWFGAGAAVASFVFFFGLGYGARLLIPFFQKPQSWKVLDFLIGIIMLSIAAALLLG